MIDLDYLREQLDDPNLTRVILTIQETRDLLEFIRDLQVQLAAEQECCCSIDWDHRCPIHGPDADEDDDDEA